MMRAVVWITEGSWEAVVDHARRLLPPEAEITLLHVVPGDVEELAAGGAGALLGRHHPVPAGPQLRRVADREALALLESAASRLGRPAESAVRRGRVEREVLEACAAADLLIAARDGRRDHLGPKSLGHRLRFVLDHAPCDVLLAWPQRPPGLEQLRWPPHLR